MAPRHKTQTELNDDPIAFRVLNEIGITSQLATTAFERMVPEGMTLAQFAVLNHFVRLGIPRSPSDLARAFQVSKATMTSTLGRLIEKDLVTTAPDDSDGRAKLVTITAEGRRMRQACVAAMAPALRRLEAKLGAGALAALIAPLGDLRAALDTMRDP